MKSICSFSKVTILLLVITCCAVLQACKKPSEGVEVTVNTDLYTTPMVFRFANANTTSATAPGSFNVTITGQDAAKVTTTEGSKTFKAQDGFLALALEKAAAPSPGNPVKFSIIANVDGFTPIVQNITITSDSSYMQEISLVEYAKPADGTSVLVQTTALNAGATNATVNLTTPVTASTTETAKITIPAGTKFLAANGNQITSGNLESKIVYYGTGTEASMNAFPGGFNANNIIGENGQLLQNGATFITAGFIAVNMKVGNTVVKSFSQPLQVVMQIRNTLINPNTGNTVKAGDVIPIWSLDENTGQWKFETNATVADNAGQLSIQYNMAHLSFWNVDWPYYGGLNTACYRGVSDGIKVIVKVADSSSFVGKIYLSTANGQQLTSYAGSYTVIEHDDTLGFAGNVPNMSGIRVVITDSRGVKIAQSQPFNPCSTGPITMNLPAFTALPKSKVFMYVKAKCTNKNISANITTPATISVYDGTKFNYYQSVYIRNGYAHFVLDNNQRYRVEVVYSGKRYVGTIDYKSADFTFNEAGTNASIKGVALYDRRSKTYVTTANISVNCN